MVATRKDGPIKSRSRGETAERLIRAAADEFNNHGFDGTDTNRIARRAGFAPQTFYRWFADKIEIFIEVYDLWQREEANVLEELLAANASDIEVVDALVEHHRTYRVFRRSLRSLSLENDKVRADRAQSRMNQIAHIVSWNSGCAGDLAELAVILLQMERLTDALAEGEFEDMGVDESGCKRFLALQVARLRPRRGASMPS